MKFLMLIALFGLAVAQAPRSQQDPKDIKILSYVNENKGDGSYNFAYENSDGTKASENGYLKPNPDPKEEPIQVAEGAFQYYAPTGELIQVQYLADENGFQPTGEHLPTPPPIPEAIQKALDIIYSNIAKSPPQTRPY